ncbi:MAG: hypothetical protein JWO57_2496, partial [Pseudonocardiales bacterium]|nr:hypothetical protein [Pseudonocardiales bacterium]
APGGMPASDRPATAVVDAIFQNCSRTGQLVPGAYNGGGQSPDLAVSGLLWWSASNWRGRVSVPLTFAPSGNVCDIVNNQATVQMYGAEGMAQATQQWAPSFCLNSKLFNLKHIQTSETQAKNLLLTGTIESAIQGAPPTTPFFKPTVQAPAALTGWTIAYSVDGGDGNPYPNLKLDARLLAKLLTESYQSCALDCLGLKAASKESGYQAMVNNPIDITRDPEFQALNPAIPPTNYLETAATLAVMSSDSDVMTALSSYVNADPEARAWLNGTPDPWGMIVNPAYKYMSLPVANWPLLDTHRRHLATGANKCLDAQPVPWLPLVASPLSNPATIALDMQFDIANSQVMCQNPGDPTQKLTALGRQAPGQRFLLGLVSLADAARYQLNTVRLQTQRSSTDNSKFTDVEGRSFAGPTDAALKAAAALLQPDDSIGSWPVPYDTMRTDPKGADAYPGTMLMSIDVPTSGLPGADAGRFAQVLHFVAGPGQTPGLGNGQLPAGYLPLTAANGLGALAAYTDKAADAVAAQQGVVPFVSGKPNPVPPSTGGTPSPSGSGTGTSSGSPTANPTPSTTSGTSPSATASAKPSAGTTAPSSVNAAAVGKTSKISSGALGLALPALALMALIGLGAAAWTSGVGRR